MKTLEYVKEHLNEFEEDDFLDRRFTKRFIDFLPVSEWGKYGFRFTGEPGTEPDPEEWTEENIMKKLKRDTYFGHEKAEGERGISSELMAMVVRGWCKVLELPDLVLENDGYYHHRQFNVVAAHFGWNLEEELEEEA